MREQMSGAGGAGMVNQSYPKKQSVSVSTSSVLRVVLIDVGVTLFSVALLLVPALLMSHLSGAGRVAAGIVAVFALLVYPNILLKSFRDWPHVAVACLLPLGLTYLLEYLHVGGAAHSRFLTISGSIQKDGLIGFVFWYSLGILDIIAVVFLVLVVAGVILRFLYNIANNMRLVIRL